MRRFIFFLSLLISGGLSAQIYLGGFVGASGYNGDLNEKVFKRLKPAIGATVSYSVTNRLNLRFGALLTSLQGGDEWSGDQFLKQNRNLSFTTDLTELSLVGELNVFNLNKINWTPYVFGGVALFYFNPYIKDSGEKLFLKPLSTEGQGLAAYPDRKPYSLAQLSIPFGGGLRFVASENVLVSVEVGLRRTLTDYLDDASTNYVDRNVLLQQKGPQAVQFSYRADEVIGETPAYPDFGYPTKGVQRGGSKYKDWYYVAGVQLVFRLGNMARSSNKVKKSYGCASFLSPQ